MTPTDRLAAKGYQLPPVASSAANYVPFVGAHGMVTISGQLPFLDGKIFKTGQVGQSVTLEEAKVAAGHCALNILAQLSAAISGDWDRVERVVRLGGFVNSPSDFFEHHLVINGASDMMVTALGERGRHARAAVGVSALPLNAAVEVDALVALRS
ncbi:MAG: RidA family protein [Pseudomonadota bacterium]